MDINNNYRVEGEQLKNGTFKYTMFRNKDNKVLYTKKSNRICTVFSIDMGFMSKNMITFRQARPNYDWYVVKAVPFEINLQDCRTWSVSQPLPRKPSGDYKAVIVDKNGIQHIEYGKTIDDAWYNTKAYYYEHRPYFNGVAIYDKDKNNVVNKTIVNVYEEPFVVSSEVLE